MHRIVQYSFRVSFGDIIIFTSNHGCLSKSWFKYGITDLVSRAVVLCMENNGLVRKSSMVIPISLDLDNTLA